MNLEITKTLDEAESALLAGDLTRVQSLLILVAIQTKKANPTATNVPVPPKWFEISQRLKDICKLNQSFSNHPEQTAVFLKEGQIQLNEAQLKSSSSKVH